MTQLIYVGDPMCSWCYGFGPELAGLLKAIPEPKLDIVMGGLRAHGTDTMTPQFTDFLRHHWQQVKDASGLPFNYSAWEHPNFVYDTEPACRAFVTARMIHPTLPPMTNLALFGNLQQAFYAKGLNVTQGEVLANVASQCLTRMKYPTDERQFLLAWGSDQAKANTQAHFDQSGRWGITGFPSLVLVKNDKLYLLSSGYTKTATLVEHYHKIMAQA